MPHMPCVHVLSNLRCNITPSMMYNRCAIAVSLLSCSKATVVSMSCIAGFGGQLVRFVQSGLNVCKALLCLESVCPMKHCSQ